MPSNCWQAPTTSLCGDCWERYVKSQPITTIGKWRDETCYLYCPHSDPARFASPTSTERLHLIANANSDTMGELGNRELIRAAADEIDALRRVASRFAADWPADVVLDVTPHTAVVFARRRRGGEG